MAVKSEVTARLGPRELRRRAKRGRCLHPNHAAELSEAGGVAGTVGVPPVGVEPTLGTLLGGRPLPLGYGGWVMIPRSVRSILAQANGGRKIRPGAHIQFMRSGPECEALPICLDLEELRTQRS